MKRTWVALAAIFRRELRSLWVTPTAWVLLFVFLALQGLSFTLMVDHFAHFAGSGAFDGPVQGYFASLFVPISLVLVCPSLTMRTLSEERRSGSIELLLTAAVPAPAVVLGKYLAVLLTYALMWAPTVLYSFILRDTGVVEWSVVFVSYVGLLLLGSAFIALGSLMSALSSSQFVALLLSTLAVFGWLVLGVGERIFDEGPLLSLSRYVSVLAQLEDFSKGVIDSRRVCLDLSVAALALFLSVRVVDGYASGRGALA